MKCSATPTRTTPRPTGFSLIELVIVVVIIGIIGAIAIPRLSRGSEGAANSALKQDLAVMNKALDLYAAEHNGQFPNALRVTQQLTLYTDLEGNTSPTPTSTHRFGPYLRKIPPAPYGEAPGSTVLSAIDTPDVGWLYRPASGRIYLNRATAIDTTKDDSALNSLKERLGL